MYAHTRWLRVRDDYNQQGRADSTEKSQLGPVQAQFKISRGLQLVWFLVGYAVDSVVMFHNPPPAPQPLKEEQIRGRKTM